MVVIASPLVKTFINSVLSMFYKPLRPLMFVTDREDFERFLVTNVEIDDEIYTGVHDSAEIQL